MSQDEIANSVSRVQADTQANMRAEVQAQVEAQVQAQIDALTRAFHSQGMHMSNPPTNLGDDDDDNDADSN